MATSTHDEILNIKVNEQTSSLDSIDRQLRDISDSLNRLESAGNNAGEGADTADNKFRNLISTVADLSHVTGGLNQVWSASKEIFEQTLGAVFDQEAAFNKLKAQTGATADEMAMFREEAEDVFLAGWGENLDDAVGAMSQVERVTHAAGDELEGLTTDALAMRDVFETDVRESIQAVDNMMNTFKIDGEHAFDVLTRGFQETGDPGGDLLEVFTEYSAAFAEMEFSAEQAMDVLNQGLKLGARNTEFVADGLREFNTRLNDMSSKDAFIALGLETVFNQFQRGEISAKDAMRAVQRELRNMDDEARKAALGAQIFGAKYEDMPGVFDQLDLSAISEEFRDVTAASEGMTGAMQSGLVPAWERIKRAGSQVLKEALEPFVVALANKAVPILEQIVPTLDKVGARLEWAFGMGKAEGIFEIKKILQELGLDALAPLVDIADSAVSTFGRFFDAFKEGGLGGVLDQAVTELKNAAPVLVAEAKDLAKTYIINPLWAELKDPRNWIAAGGFMVTLTKELLGLQWDAMGWVKERLIVPAWNELIKRENWVGAGDFARRLVGEILGMTFNAAVWMRSNIIEPGWRELTNRDNWIDASNFARKLVGEILGKTWSASLWMRNHIIEPGWNALTNKDNWSSAADFLRKLMGEILGLTWDAASWVRTNIIDPMQREINNLLPSISIPSPSDLINGITGAFKGAGQINLAPGASYKTSSGMTFSTAVSNLQASGKNYNPNYKVPQYRDHGGRGVPGQPYKIGVPELFIPDRPGTFIPLADTGGGMQPLTVQLVLDGRVIYETYVKEEQRRNPGGRRK